MGSIAAQKMLKSDFFMTKIHTSLARAFRDYKWSYSRVVWEIGVLWLGAGGWLETRGYGGWFAVGGRVVGGW